MTTRRDFLKSSGYLVVGIGAIAHADLAGAGGGQGAAAQGAGPYPDPDFRQLDSWIVVREDSTATFYVGKTDLGQGTGTAFRQIMADELDIAYDRTRLIMGSTDVTVDQGGSGGSDAIQTDGWPMRRVAAEARRVLLGLASARFGVPVDRLAVSDGVISVDRDVVALAHHFDEPRGGSNRGFVDAEQLRAGDRWLDVARVQHAGKLDVDRPLQ